MTGPRDPRTAPALAGWATQALCVGHDMHPDHPSRAAGLPTLAELTAIAVCKPCPVKTECLTAGWAEEHGIWGGTTPAQRRQALRAKARLNTRRRTA